MLLDEHPANMQPKAKPNPGAALVLDSLRAMEALPDALLFLWWQSWPFVAHPDPRLPLVDLEPDLDGAICW